MTTKLSKNYIDNKKMLEAFVEHRRKTQEARAVGRQDPVLPDYLGRCFMLMTERIGTKFNFANYSYLDEMKDDGLENCVIAANNFDPEKSSNPFGYFTKIIWFAFLRRIAKEQKQAVIKYKLLQHMAMDDSLFTSGSDDFKSLNMKVNKDSMDAAITNYEEKQKKKEAKTKPKKVKDVDASLDEFLQDAELTIQLESDDID